LPTGSAVALRMHRSGATETDIALALGIEVDAVPAALQVATAELTALRRPDDAI